MNNPTLQGVRDLLELSLVKDYLALQAAQQLTRLFQSPNFDPTNQIDLDKADSLRLGALLARHVQS